MRVAVLDDDEKMLPYYVEEIASAFQHLGQEAQVKSYPIFFIWKQEENMWWYMSRSGKKVSGCLFVHWRNR